MTADVAGRGLESSLNVEVGMASRTQAGVKVKALSSCIGNTGQQWETQNLVLLISPKYD